jgi:hypothetical protein
MPPLPEHNLVRRRETSLEAATIILEIHVATDDGICDGCLQVWGRWVPSTGCTQLVWARSVLETHGVDDDAWDRYGSVGVLSLR